MADGTPRVTFFSYGMFQLPDVQLSTFGRLVAGTDDVLRGHTVRYVEVPGSVIARMIGGIIHPNAIATEDPADEIIGRALQLTEAELEMADVVQMPGLFARRRVTLASGREAWVYAQP